MGRRDLLQDRTDAFSSENTKSLAATVARLGRDRKARWGNTQASEPSPGGRRPTPFFPALILLQKQVGHKYHFVNSLSHLWRTGFCAEDKCAPSLRAWWSWQDGRVDLWLRGLGLPHAASVIFSVPFCVLSLGCVHTMCASAEKGPRIRFRSVPASQTDLADATLASVNPEHGGHATRGWQHIWGSRWLSHKAQSAWRLDALRRHPKAVAHPPHHSLCRALVSRPHPGSRAAAAGAQASEPHVYHQRPRRTGAVRPRRAHPPDSHSPDELRASGWEEQPLPHPPIKGLSLNSHSLASKPWASNNKSPSCSQVSRVAPGVGPGLLPGSRSLDSSGLAPLSHKQVEGSNLGSGLKGGTVGRGPGKQTGGVPSAPLRIGRAASVPERQNKTQQVASWGHREAWDPHVCWC